MTYSSSIQKIFCKMCRIYLVVLKIQLYLWVGIKKCLRFFLETGGKFG